MEKITSYVAKTKDQLSQLEGLFTETQLDAIKLIIRKGLWGDCDQEFNGKTYYAYGFYTNMNKGKQWSGILSGISKKIKSSSTEMVCMISDWWGNGSGDMFFFNMDFFNYEDLKEWSKI